MLEEVEKVIDLNHDCENNLLRKLGLAPSVDIAPNTFIPVTLPMMASCNADLLKAFYKIKI